MSLVCTVCLDVTYSYVIFDMQMRLTCIKKQTNKQKTNHPTDQPTKQTNKQTTTTANGMNYTILVDRQPN